MDAEWASDPVCAFWRREVPISPSGIRTLDNKLRREVAELSSPFRLHMMRTFITEEAPVIGLQVIRSHN
jgi:hypothetical protein